MTFLDVVLMLGDHPSVQSSINNGPVFLLVCPAIATHGG